ncbi:MAG: AAA domain-containing protein [Polaromonas sp.]
MTMPQLVGNRYLLIPNPGSAEPNLQGGMASIFRAIDSTTGQNCALKIMRAGINLADAKESFERERRALEKLSSPQSHRNIVQLLNVGMTEDNDPYLVLEWVPTNLTEWINTHGAFSSWNSFYETIGRPILDAIAFAHKQDIAHRDIKPENILILDDVPKIIDFGIARAGDLPSVATLLHYKSTPYAPEVDDPRFHTSRDCYSWAVIAISCMEGRRFLTESEVRNALDELHLDSPLVEILGHAIDVIPRQRFVRADALLAELDRYAQDQAFKSGRYLKMHLTLTDDAAEMGRRLFYLPDRSTVEATLLADLNEFASVNIDAPEQGDHLIRILGSAWTLEATPFHDESRLEVRRLTRLRPGDAERRREHYLSTPLRFSFGLPSDRLMAKRDLSELRLKMSHFLFEQEVRQKEIEKERIFRLWIAFLQTKQAFEKKKQKSISYTSMRFVDDRAILTTGINLGQELIGEHRLIRSGGGRPIPCVVRGVHLGELIISLSSSTDFGRLPRQGILEANIAAAEKAIDRQRAAIDAIQLGEATLMRLKELLVDASTAAAPATITGLSFADSDLSPDKLEALYSAIALKECLAIHGPPGTGKTRLITEIISRYIRQYPQHRVLLSAQTHTALDNVIEKLIELAPNLNIVRVGAYDEEKISPKSRPFLLEEKALAWSAKVRVRAHRFLDDFANKNGISKEEVEVGILAEEIIAISGRQIVLRNEIAELEDKVKAVEDASNKLRERTALLPSDEELGATSSILGRVGELYGDLAKAKRAEKDAREALGRLGQYGAALADKETDALIEWAEVLLKDSPGSHYIKELVTLQQEWLARLGYSEDFYKHLVTEAQVVAGTCVGIAGLRDGAEIAYDLCIVDEASKATATEALVPMARASRWIVVGDPQQLPPFFEAPDILNIEGFDKEEVKQTILDRWLLTLPQHSKVYLTEQHRMIKGIGDLISAVFYEKKLQSNRISRDVRVAKALKKPVLWISTSCLESRAEHEEGTGYSNQSECELVGKTLSLLNTQVKSGGRPVTVAVIAGYLAQVRLLEETIAGMRETWGGLNIACDTVDAFQGSEADVCIYSITRSNEHRKFGFIKEPPRLNVALSRGRDALVIVGDADFCRECEDEKSFGEVITYIERNSITCGLTDAKP